MNKVIYHKSKPARFVSKATAKRERFHNLKRFMMLSSLAWVVFFLLFVVGG